MLAIALDRRVLFLAVVLGLFSLLDEPLLGFLVAYLERVRHLSAALAAAPILGILVGGMAGYGAYERLTGGRGRRRVIVLSALVMAVTLAITVFAPWLALQTLAGAGFGASAAIFYTTYDAMVLALPACWGRARSDQRRWFPPSALIGIGFPPLVGLVADHAGLGAGIALYAVIPVLVPLALGGAGSRGASTVRLDARLAELAAAETAFWSRTAHSRSAHDSDAHERAPRSSSAFGRTPTGPPRWRWRARPPTRASSSATRSSSPPAPSARSITTPPRPRRGRRRR